MRSNNSFDMELEGMKLHVEFEMSGPLSTGDEMEIESVTVKTEEDIFDLFSTKARKQIEAECFNHLPDGYQAQEQEDC